MNDTKTNTDDPNLVGTEENLKPADQPVAEGQAAPTEPQTPAEEVEAEETTEAAGEKQEENPEEKEVQEEKQDEEGQSEEKNEEQTEESAEDEQSTEITSEPTQDQSGARWYVVHTYSGHENRVAQALKQRVESEHLESRIVDVLVPTQEKIEIRSGKKETVKEKLFPGYILVKMVLDDNSWLAVRTTQGVTSFIGMGSKPTPISEAEVKSIVNFMQQGGQPTYKQLFSEGDTVKIVDGPFTDFIGKVESVDKEKGKVRVLVSIFGRETPVELDFLQVAKL